jgi:LPS sulfotransferase NodH
MSRRLKLQLRAGKALYNEACRKAAEAFSERRFRDALAIYEQFAEEHPDTHTDEIQVRTHALKEYIEDHVERPQTVSPPSTPA